MEEKSQIHFVRCALADYEALRLKQETDPDTLYFCSVTGKGFCLFMGEKPLELYSPQSGGQEPQQ
jgi:hypothetical protein